MNDGQLANYFDDLKQFITVTVSQSEASLEARLTKRIDSLEHRLEQKMDDGFGAIADIIQSHNDQLDNHENRISLLERHTA